MAYIRVRRTRILSHFFANAWKKANNQQYVSLVKVNWITKDYNKIGLRYFYLKLLMSFLETKPLQLYI